MLQITINDVSFEEFSKNGLESLIKNIEKSF